MKQCPKCGFLFTSKEGKKKKGLYYYSKVYLCLNKECKTNVFFFESDKVWNDKQSEKQHQSIKAIRDKESFLDKLEEKRSNFY